MSDNRTMSGPNLVNAGPPATEATIAKLENALGHRLPAVYRRFLLAHNGGRPDPEGFAKNGKPFSILSVFFSVGVRDKFYDLATQFRSTRKEMPAEVMPIAIDLGGNLICLAIKGKNRGKVYFWDHEGAPENIDPRIEFPWLDLGDDYEFKGDDWPGHPDLTLIADSFVEFLNSFYDFEPEDAPVLAKPTQDTEKPPARAGATGKQPAKAKSAKTKPAGK